MLRWIFADLSIMKKVPTLNEILMILKLKNIYDIKKIRSVNKLSK